jgi:SAM-dependent methyltransferase
MAIDFLEKTRQSLARRGLVGSMRRALQLAAEIVTSPITSRLRMRRKRAIRRAIDDQFDRTRGVDTGGTLEPDELGATGSSVDQITLYQAVYPGPFTEVIEQLPIDFQRFTFIDIGSGKGRALFLAAEYPFEKIVGIELSPELCRVAEANFTSYHSPTQRCRAIEVRCQDALEFELPALPTLLFFYNPFQEALMRQIVEKVAQSLAASPRPLYVVYFNPKTRRVWDAVEVLEPLDVRQPNWPGFTGQVVAVWKTRSAKH